MEMEKVYYVVTSKPAYLELRESATHSTAGSEEGEGVGTQRIIVAITQGGFGQDVVDDERQAKERFLEHLFLTGDLDLPRTEEIFDLYFEMAQADEFVDLDEEA